MSKQQQDGDTLLRELEQLRHLLNEREIDVQETHIPVLSDVVPTTGDTEPATASPSTASPYDLDRIFEGETAADEADTPEATPRQEAAEPPSSTSPLSAAVSQARFFPRFSLDVRVAEETATPDTTPGTPPDTVVETLREQLIDAVIESTLPLLRLRLRQSLRALDDDTLQRLQSAPQPRDGRTG